RLLAAGVLLLHRDLIGGGDRGGIALAQVLQSLGGGERPRGVGQEPPAAAEGPPCVPADGHGDTTLPTSRGDGRPRRPARRHGRRRGLTGAARRAAGRSGGVMGRTGTPAQPLPEILRLDTVTSTQDEAARR